MAISREEIEAIAESVATKVVERAKACRCGYAVWKLADDLDLIQTDTRVERKEPILVLRGYHDDLVDQLGICCGVDVDEVRTDLEDLYDFAQSGNWDEARDAVQRLRENIGDGLYTCAEKEVS